MKIHGGVLFSLHMTFPEKKGYRSFEERMWIKKVGAGGNVDKGKKDKERKKKVFTKRGKMW